MSLIRPKRPEDEALRRPRLVVKIGGEIVPGAMSARISSNNFYEADRFEVTLALNALYGRASHLAALAAESDLRVEVKIGFDTGQGNALFPGRAADVEGETLITGRVDTPEYDMDAGTVTLVGRDLASLFIDQPLTDAFQNQTASEIVQALAAKRGFKAAVTPTRTLAGRYFRNNTEQGATPSNHPAATEWELMVMLARREECDLFVKGETLHFRPFASSTAEPYVVRHAPPEFSAPDLATHRPRGVRGLRFTVNKLASRAIKVTVRSWNSELGRTVSATYPKGKAAGDTQDVTREYPNLTEEQCARRAQQVYNEAVMNERVAEWSEPGKTSLTPRSPVQVTGTAELGFDQTYYVAQITREIAFDGGFTMNVRATNKREGRDD